MAETILIVDDEPDTLQFISIYLRSQGYQVFEALDGKTALAMARERKPDLIVLDVMMPEMDGLEVARRLRSHPDTALTPILMFTAKSQTQDKLSGYDAGADIYLAKPSHPVELNANVKALLAQSKARKVAKTEKGYMVGVIAAKGGLGVSSIALNSAISLTNRFKKKVIAMETRPGQSSWQDELGVSGIAGLDQLLDMSPNEIHPGVIEKQLVSHLLGVPLLFASNRVHDAAAATAVGQYAAILENISALAEIVIVDIGTIFHPAYEVFTEFCDEMILITEPQPLSVRLTKNLLANLQERKFGGMKALTMITVNRVLSGMSMPVSKLEEKIGYPISAGFTPVPEQAFMSADRNIPLYTIQPGSQIVQQFDKLAEIILKHIAA